ncbi:MAG: hypothetical protein ABFS34_14510 [Gemmatimonadota bacterium]
MKSVVLAGTIALAAVAAINPASSEYDVLDEHAEPLRSTFNADSGKVRIVALVAPT